MPSVHLQLRRHRDGARRTRHSARRQSGKPHQPRRPVREGPFGHPSAVQPLSQQVPHEARGGARHEQLRAHQLGSGYRGDRAEAHAGLLQVRRRVAGDLYGRRREPALQLAVSLHAGVGIAEHLRAGLRAVLPAAHGHVLAHVRRQQVGHHVDGRFQVRRLFVAVLPGGQSYPDAGHVGHLHQLPRAQRFGARHCRAARTRAGAQHGSGGPSLHARCGYGRRVAAHSSRNRRGAYDDVDPLHHREQAVRRRFLQALDEPAVPHRHRYEEDAARLRSGPGRSRCGRCGKDVRGVGSEDELREGAAMAVRRSAGPRVLRHVRDRRRRIPHGVHAAAGARGRMDARKGLRGMLP